MAAESFLVRALSDLINDFNGRGLQYALAGGWAYSALVEPRATTDIDFLVLVEQPSPENIRNLLSAQFDSTVIHPAPMVFKGISIWRCVGIRQDREVVVDFLLADSDYLRTALTHRRTVGFLATQVSVLALEDLILLKTLAGRLQDQADLEEIRSRQDELDIDWGYVKEWKSKLGLSRQ
jgi:hypothetical protein